MILPLALRYRSGNGLLTLAVGSPWLHGEKFTVEALDGQAHDVEVGAFEARDADVTNPLLNAIGSSLVKGTVVSDVIVDFVVGEFGKGHKAGRRKSPLNSLIAFPILRSARTKTSAGQRHPCNHLVRASAELFQHRPCIGGISGLAQHLMVDIDDGVGRDEQFIVGQRQQIGSGLLSRNIFGNVLTTQVVGVRFVDSLQGPHLEVDAEAC